MNFRTLRSATGACRSVVNVHAWTRPLLVLDLDQGVSNEPRMPSVHFWTTLDVMTFGEWLGIVMEEASFPTNTALAEASGVNAGSISRWRNGIEPPSVPALRKLSPALGVPMRELLVRAEIVTWEEQEYDAPLPDVDASDDIEAKFEAKFGNLEMSDEARKVIFQEFQRMHALTRTGRRTPRRVRIDAKGPRKTA